MKYKIIATYQTGDSGRSYETNDTVTEHDDLAIAKANLQRIKEHYQFYEKYEDLRTVDSQEKAIAAILDKPWAVNVPVLYNLKTRIAVDRIPAGKEANYGYKPNYFFVVHCLKLQLDNGEDFQQSASWCGHFERLHALEIVLNDEDEGLRIEF